MVLGRNTQGLGLSTSTTISGSHFKIWREPCLTGSADGGVLVFVKDSSTNGTFLNGERLERGRQHLVESGNDISMLNPKKSADHVTWTFQDVRLERDEDVSGPASKYEIGEILGTGTFAVVRVVTERATGKRWAMKVIEKKKFRSSTKRPDALRDEVEVLKAVSHPNIIAIKEMFETQRRIYLVLEMATGGELFDRIVSSGKFSEERARDVLVQCLEAVKYLHAKGIAHRDLKPENILCIDRSENCQIRLTDFGLSRIVDENAFMKTMCGTPNYVAPEILAGTMQGYTNAVDLWSAGVILYVMLCGFQPFVEESGGTSELYTLIKTGKFTFPSPWWDTISAEAKDLCTKLIMVDPKRRLTAEQALQHPWVLGQKFQEPGRSVVMTDAFGASQANVSMCATEPPTTAPGRHLTSRLSSIMDVDTPTAAAPAQQQQGTPISARPEEPRPIQKAPDGADAVVEESPSKKRAADFLGKGGQGEESGSGDDAEEEDEEEEGREEDGDEGTADAGEPAKKTRRKGTV